MNGWVCVNAGLPNEGVECIVAQKVPDAIMTYKKYVAWDGCDWVDIDGNVVTDVYAWRKAPEFSYFVVETLNRLKECAENDKCERTDCLYFVEPGVIERMIENFTD